MYILVAQDKEDLSVCYKKTCGRILKMWTSNKQKKKNTYVTKVEEEE